MAERERGGQRCNPCQRIDRVVAAVAFCEVCQEYFCNDCLQFHRRLRITRTHDENVVYWENDTPEFDTTGFIRSNVLRADDRGKCLELYECIEGPSIDGEEKCYITDIKALPNGDFLACDFENSKVKLLDKRFKIKGCLSLDDKPAIAAVLSDRGCVVACPKGNQVLFLERRGDTLRVQTDRTIRFEKQCHSVAFGGGQLYVSCSKNPGDSEVKVFDLVGKQVRVVPGTDGFQYPYYMAVAAGRLYISSREDNKLACMTTAGELIWSRTLDTDIMRNVHGFLLDESLNMYVCSSRTNKILFLDKDGQGDRVMFAGEPEVQQYFTTMLYRGSDERLIVGCYNDGFLQTFAFVDRRI